MVQTRKKRSTISTIEMNTSQTPAPIDKKEYITAIGALLVLEHGKKNNYLPEEIQEAHKKK